MAVRVSRQGVEILYLPDPTVRVSRQAANVLYKETGVVRVSRQHVEVLGPAPQIYEKSASSTLVLTQLAEREALIIERSASSALSLGQSGVANKELNLYASSTLVLTQENTIDTDPKYLSASSILVLSQETAFPGTHLLSATSILNLTDVAVNSGIITASASSTLSLVQYADEEVKARDATSVLTLTDTASVDKILRGFSTLNLTQNARTTKELFATSELTLTQTARPGLAKAYATSQIEFTQSTVTNIKSLDASSTLELSHSNVVLKPIYVSALSELSLQDEFYWDDETGDLVRVELGLRQEAAAELDANLTASSVLPLVHEASAHVARATGISLSASSTLTFTQRAIPEAIEESVTSTLVLTQTAVVDVAKPGASTLSLTQVATQTIDRGISGTSTLDLQQSVTYTLIIGNTKCQYSPFVGDNSDPNAPDPPPAEIDGPMVGIQVPFQLVYPSTGAVSDSVALKTPNLGNKDRLSFQRVIREARGGTLIVYADPIWPKTQTLALTFTGLLRVEAHELLTFIDDHLGLEIGLIDWEHRYWRGIITQPDEPAIEDKFDRFTVNFQFEGELDPAWNPQVVPPALRYSAVRSAQQDGYYVPIEPQVPVAPELLDYYEAEADSTIIIGNPLYIVSGTGHVDLAQADTSATAQVAGLSLIDIASGGTCQFISEGNIVRSDWSSITGSVNLSAGVFYYLDPSTAGRLTSTAPSTPGQYVVRIGRAINTTTLDIEIELPILL